MKKIILLLFVAFFANEAHARRGRIPVCFPCEKIATVQDLPNEDSLKQNGSFLNLGYLHNEYGIIFIPAWNSGGKYVLVNNDESIYYDLSEAQLEELKKTHNLELSSNPLSFWKKIGGKLIYLIVIGFILYGQFSKGDDEEPAAPEA